MKKKLLVILICVLCPAFMAGAQEAFKNLSVGLEVGTTGVGIDVGSPIVQNKLVAKVGFYVPSFSISVTDDGPANAVNAWVNRVNDQLAGYGLDDRLATISDATLYVSPVANLNTAKLVVEYYPFEKSSFHIVAGIFIGLGNKIATATVTTDQAFWSSYKALQSVVAEYNAAGYDLETFDLRYNVGADRNFGVSDNGNVGYFDAYAKVNTVRPYLGLGFGRSIPKTNFGFQFDFGVWYHGKPRLTISDEGEYNTLYDTLWFDDISLMNKIVVYPQLTFRLIYKIF